MRPYEIGIALAARLGITPTIFPGDHIGFGPHAAEFTGTLARALSAD
jgi:hypothetical protein